MLASWLPRGLACQVLDDEEAIVDGVALEGAAELSGCGGESRAGRGVDGVDDALLVGGWCRVELGALRLRLLGERGSDRSRDSPLGGVRGFLISCLCICRCRCRCMGRHLGHFRLCHGRSLAVRDTSSRFRAVSLLALPLALVLLPRLLVPHVPEPLMIDERPTSIGNLDPAPLKLGRARVLVRAEKLLDRSLDSLNRDARLSGEAWDARADVAVPVRHGEHGEPDDPRRIVLAPNRGTQDRGEHFNVGFGHVRECTPTVFRWSRRRLRHLRQPHLPLGLKVRRVQSLGVLDRYRVGVPVARRNVAALDKQARRGEVLARKR